MSVLRVEKVAKLFGSKLVFKNVSCSVETGEALIVAGPNGAGKSTLLKLMAGLARPSAGTVESTLAEEKTAYLGHATFLYPNLTARQNLAFWAKMYGITSPDIEGVLERVRLTRFAEERAGSFSRGMAQRLNLGRIFLVSPELVFLDEPGTGLDVASLALLHREIQALRDGGAAVVWVSHQVEHDKQLVDKVLELKSGKVAFYGPAAEYVLEPCSC
ncbi:MAG: heme ABC exporter ATP-binding protein CcmA [Proteobacteria bacterium]|nr:heme ABC exporter ATP-binding protein CcmA [Pseudomonadota bacterium]MBU1612710.1 heme ABC exporter ATP-binding protein CcmA [Pseudomonadota bacterium]